MHISTAVADLIGFALDLCFGVSNSECVDSAFRIRGIREFCWGLQNFGKLLGKFHILSKAYVTCPSAFLLHTRPK